MKKHEILKHAYDSYPKGTMFTWGGDTITSSGKFHFNDGFLVTTEGLEEFMVYDGSNWAGIIFKQSERLQSILNGNDIAIQVNNEREFELLMNHYEEKGWKSLSGHKPIEVGFVKRSWAYCDAFAHASLEYRKLEGVNVIAFDEFAKAAGIQVPKYILTSEDGVEMYDNDDYFAVYLNYHNECYLSSFCYKLCANCSAMTSPKAKAFSTKKADEKWIEEKNNKDIVLSFNSFLTVTISNSGILVNNSQTNMKQLIFNSELNKIVEAYNIYKNGNT